MKFFINSIELANKVPKVFYNWLFSNRTSKVRAASQTIGWSGRGGGGSLLSRPDRAQTPDIGAAEATAEGATWWILRRPTHSFYCEMSPGVKWPSPEVCVCVTVQKLHLSLSGFTVGVNGDLGDTGWV